MEQEEGAGMLKKKRIWYFNIDLKRCVLHGVRVNINSMGGQIKWKPEKTFNVDNFALGDPIEVIFFFKPLGFSRRSPWSSSKGAWGDFLTPNFIFFLYLMSFLRILIF